jgi:hypothetical protein
VGAIKDDTLELSGKVYPISAIYTGEQSGETIVEMNTDDRLFVADENPDLKSKGCRFALIVQTGTTGATTTIVIK